MKNEIECEVCGNECRCMKTRSGMHVCSTMCKQIAEGTNSNGKVPLDVMFKLTERNYFRG